MDPHQIITQANRDVERLATENGDLRSSIATLEDAVESYKLMIQDQTIIILNTQAETHAALAQRDLLGHQVAYIELFSDEGAAASAASIGFLEGRLHEAEATGQTLSQQASVLTAETIRLQAIVAKLSQQSAEDKERTKKNVETIGRLTAEVLMKTIRRNESDKKLRDIDGELDKVKTDFDKLVAVREDLSSRLAALNLESQKLGNKTKNAIRRTAKENEKLAKELERAEARVRENNNLKEDLCRKAREERKLQKTLQKTLDEAETLRSSVDFYRTEDKKQMETISNYQKQLHQLMNKERAAGFGKAIREKEVEVEKLTELVKKMETKLEQKERLVGMALLRAKESAATVKQKELEVAGWKGDALTNSFRSLDALKIERFELSKEILDSVKNALKDIDSSKKAQNAIATIQGLLATAEFRMATYSKDIEVTICHINGLIKDIRGFVEKAKEPQDFIDLIDDVHELQLGLENSIKEEKEKGKKLER